MRTGSHKPECRLELLNVGLKFVHAQPQMLNFYLPTSKSVKENGHRLLEAQDLLLQPGNLPSEVIPGFQAWRCR